MGTSGILAGQPCRVVGCTERAEVNEAGEPQYRWLEYQLYHPATKEYTQLAVYNGHWLAVRPAKRNYHVLDAQTRRAYVGQPDGIYKLYNRYKARVLFAVGEFDWDIEGDDQAVISEFICPPRMLVEEKTEKAPKASTWYQANNLEPYEVAIGFNLRLSDLPAQEGVGAVQPDPVQTSWPALRRLTAVAVGLLVLAQVALAILRPSQILLNENLHVVTDPATPGTGKVIVSPSFTLPTQSALQIDLSTTLNNQWLELPVSLVNEQTGQGFEFTKNIEYYAGVEDGENWSEGSRDANAVLSAVPAGRYHLNLYPLTEAGPAAPDIQVRVEANPPLIANFLVVLALLLLYPAWQYWRGSNHETRRWDESDYGPTA
ncbi:DUF4178 domain-containing protein [Hymenobacter sp. BT664]|uniref:DUF4178 domain-containing protein n=1 Tax=Hymenobacter montanus TaxID=2771359 RepID=A0A927GJ34_9BACT|nr:DUF4178 domain-containing protein [Hymenobacter montanus]MBD2767995.1 DUF4178 domain-containing protein [Hymenobacter montanus]